MGKAAAKKKDADNVVELKRNGPNPDSIDTYYLGRLKKELDEFASASGRMRANQKAIGSKIDLKAAKEAIAIQKSGKAEEHDAYLVTLLRYRRLLNAGASKKQLEMFDAVDDRAPAPEKAKEHGFNCGIQGLGMDQNPYAVDSEAGQEWLKSWHAGNDERKEVETMEGTLDELIKGDAGDDDVFDEGDDGASDEDEFDKADPSKTAAE